MRTFPKAKGQFWEVRPAVRAEAEPTATDLWVYDVIGDDWYDSSLTAKELCQTIAAIDTAEIVLHLSSPGGSVSDGLAIYNALISHPAKVTSRVEGWTASMATIVALAGSTVEMYDNALFMIHNPLMVVAGNAASLREQADWLERVGGIMRTIYMSRCTKTEAELQAAPSRPRRTSPPTRRSTGASPPTSWSPSRPPPFVPPRASSRRSDCARPRAPAAPSRTPSEAKLRDAGALIDDVLGTSGEQARVEAPPALGDAPTTMDNKAMASLLTAARRH